MNRKNKLNAHKITFFGHTFDSIKEGKFYLTLKADKHEGLIKDFEMQVPYEFKFNNTLICTYYLDFMIINNSGKKRYIDIKGYRKGATYAIFRIKKKLMQAFYGINVEEI